MRADSLSAVVARFSSAAFSASLWASASTAALASLALMVSLMAWEASWAATRAWSAMTFLSPLAAMALPKATWAPSIALGFTAAALSRLAISKAFAACLTAAGVGSLYWMPEIESMAGL